MSHARIVLVAAPELIPALRERVGREDEVLTFADSEPLRALDTIMAIRPPLVALERLFAASPRGAALISRIKADPSLDGAEIRILSHNSNYSRVSPRPKRPGAPPPVVVQATLDSGTRRAVRYRMRPGLRLMVDDQPASLLDLSALGAQIVSPVPVKPGQKVAMVMGPGGAGLTVTARIVWAKLELARGTASYRAGVEFTAADQGTVVRFARAHEA